MPFRLEPLRGSIETTSGAGLADAALLLVAVGDAAVTGAATAGADIAGAAVALGVAGGGALELHVCEPAQAAKAAAQVTSVAVA